MTIINPNTHIYLYAKGHYQKTDNVIDDLKLIISNRNKIPIEHISKIYVINILLKITYFHISNKFNSISLFSDFVISLAPENHWKISSKKLEIHEAIIYKCLSILRSVKVVDMPDTLGNPDPDILPLRRENKND
jgi:hypothetical protein